MEKIDRYGVFAEPVSDSDAPDYSDIVKNPIDLATMKTKLNNGEYGEGTKGASKLYADFLLMFDNCRLYNDDDGEVTEEAARIMALLPEIYGSSCSTALKKQKK
ncbi:Bromodomain-containing protein [Fragilariopsis cylindrus CCMP1102]|uniref:Bromodomain-containing protein n=1 Tax=Fragilariopsis cylindrus CCMP1102 TaxID=635003 RepID=A0A1E7EUY3_9STRA|nr:Bromodomain-containing protein [Fragilariopsis cylindrus CCMP1102]|eukprot:OEU09614.1 Bromodomain-containing protein [Fragilariopsis cylindrus CCMP1102]